MLDITKMTFDCVDMPDLWNETGIRLHRLTESDLAGMPDDTKDLDTLKIKLYDLLREKLGGYDKLEADCDIKRDTFQKAIRFSNSPKNERSINYTMLAKFSIGAKLTETDAAKLFALMGHKLSEQNRCDYILLHELRNHGTLLDYDEDMIRFGYGSILSKAD